MQNPAGGPPNGAVADPTQTGAPPTALVPRVLDTPHGRKVTTWSKGMPSPNPGGRPQGLAKRVREMVNFDQAIQTLVDIAWGKLAPASRVADRIKAIELLFDRGFGKAQQIVDIKDGNATPASSGLKHMSTPKLIATVEAMRALAAGAAEGGSDDAE